MRRQTKGWGGAGWTVGVAVAMVLVPADLAAQYLGGGTKSAAEAQVADLADMRDKFTALGGAFEAGQLDWRPMEGVRSVRDQLALVAAEATLFPTMWGFEGAAWTAAEGGFQGELARLGALSQEELVDEIQRSFDHSIALIEGFDAEEREMLVRFFGLEVPLGTAVTLMANDMHEHLGKLIAYARMNGVVPPWSRGDGG